MNRRIAVPAMAVAAAVAWTSSLAAQTLETGTWTGTVMPPEGGAIEVTYEVAQKGDSLSVTLHTGAFGSFAFESIVVHADRITFTWSPDEMLTCELMLRDDDRYEGECVDSGGMPGTLVMRPPKDSHED